MKTKVIIYMILSVFLLGFSSCLESGLDELPTYTDAEITAVNFEYRWTVAENTNDSWGGEKLQVKTLSTTATFNDGVIECVITVPAASGTFTDAVRSNVTLSNLNAYVTISPGATISPVGNAPVLGKLGDFTPSDISYQVVSADKKNKKVWQLVIKSFNK